jgi:hypothetical protein
MFVTQDYKIRSMIAAAKNAGLIVVCALLIAAGPILEAAGLLRG